MAAVADVFYIFNSTVVDRTCFFFVPAVITDARFFGVSLY